MTNYFRSGNDIDRGLVGYWKLDDLKRVSTDGIVAHYKMNDNAADKVVIDSKGGKTGTASANTSTKTVAGKINEALDFNGTTDSISTPYHPSDLGNLFSISIWINPDTTDTEFRDFLRTDLWSNPGNLAFFVRSGVINCSLTDLESTQVTVADSISTGTWTHFIITNDGTNLILYKNNSQVDSVSSSGKTFMSDSAAFIMMSPQNDFDGKLDDIRFYNRVLSTSERATIYNSGNGTETTELFRTTVVAIDRVNFNDGTITGCTNADGQNWKPSDSMSFDGVDDIITSVATGISHSNPIYVSMWINVNNFIASGTALTFVDGTKYFRCIAQEGPTSADWGFRVSIAGWLDDGYSSGSRTLPNTNEWYHVVYGWDKTHFKIHVNGELYLKDTASATNTFNPNVLYFGRDRTGSLFFDGKLNKIRIYNRVLTDGEISKLYRLKL